MLYDTKTIDTIGGPRSYEFREGTGGRGQPVYIIASFMGDGYNRSYHEERFENLAEAQAWFDCIM